MAGRREPPRAVAFVDGQNLYHAARRCFAYVLPNFDVLCLSQVVCASRGWELGEVRFYTSVRRPSDEPFWCNLWAAKLAAMGREGVRVYARPLVYRRVKLRTPEGVEFAFLARQEKGIDVRIALDIVRMAHRREYDVALVFSQDQDLSEVAKEIRTIAREQRRWIKIASAYPEGGTGRGRCGIERTDWIPIDRKTYDACIDPHDYRPRSPMNPGGGS